MIDREALRLCALTPREAMALQRQAAAWVEPVDRLSGIHTVAAIDLGFPRRDRCRAAVVLCDWPELQPIDSICAESPVEFPYVPGLLSYREVPAAWAALQRLRHQPDLLLCDGHGVAHPRRFGLACHLGVLCDLPSIGVAKSRLIGQFTPPGTGRGERTPLLDGAEQIGTVLRSRTGVSPLFVSIGHRVSLPTAVDLVLATCRRYRLPEPARLAHRLASARN